MAETGGNYYAALGLDVASNTGTNELHNAIMGTNNLIEASANNFDMLQKANNDFGPGMQGLTNSLTNIFQKNAKETQDKQDRENKLKELDAKAIDTYNSLNNFNNDEINNKSIQETGSTLDDLNNSIDIRFNKLSQGKISKEYFMNLIKNPSLYKAFELSHKNEDGTSLNNMNTILQNIQSDNVLMNALFKVDALNAEKDRLNRGEYTAEEAYDKANRLKTENPIAYRNTTTQDLADLIFMNSYGVANKNDIEKALFDREKTILDRNQLGLFVPSDKDKNTESSQDNKEDKPNKEHKPNSVSNNIASTNNEPKSLDNNITIQEPQKEQQIDIPSDVIPLVTPKGELIEETKQTAKDIVVENSNADKALSDTVKQLSESGKNALFSIGKGIKDLFSDRSSNVKNVGAATIASNAMRYGDFNWNDNHKKLSKHGDDLYDLIHFLDDDKRYIEQNGFLGTANNYNPKFIAKLNQVDFDEMTNDILKELNIETNNDKKLMLNNSLKLIGAFARVKDSQEQINRLSKDYAEKHKINVTATTENAYNKYMELEKKYNDLINQARNVSPEKAAEIEKKTNEISTEQQANLDKSHNAQQAIYSNDNTSIFKDDGTIDTSLGSITAVATFVNQNNIQFIDKNGHIINQPVTKMDNPIQAYIYMYYDLLLDNTDSNNKLRQDLRKNTKDNPFNAVITKWNSKLSKEGISRRDMESLMKDINSTLNDLDKRALTTKAGLAIDKELSADTLTSGWKLLQNSMNKRKNIKAETQYDIYNEILEFKNAFNKN